MPKSQERNQNITKHSNTYNGGLFLLKKKKRKPNISSASVGQWTPRSQTSAETMFAAHTVS